MTEKPVKTPDLLEEVQDLRARLNEAQETLRAIRSGEVDALVVKGPEGEQIYTLKGAEEPYRVMVEAMAEGALTFTREGTILYSNARFAHLLKLPMEQTLGSSLQRFAAPHERDRFEARLKRSILTPTRWETILQTPDGTLVPVLFSSHPLKWGEDEVIAAVVTDLSDLFAAEEAKSRLALIIESSNDAIISTDLNGIVKTWNPGAERLFGYSSKEAVGTQIQRLIAPPGRAAEIERRLVHILTAKEGGSEEMVRMRKDGTLVDVSVTASPIKSIAGEIIGMSEILRDVTEQKRLERELAQHRDHLEQLVEQRTEELRQANTHLQDLDRLKSMFIASMSHELRTPLNSIIGFTGVLLQGLAGELNDEQRKQLTIVKDSSHHLLDLINDVIDVSKIESGKVELTTSRFDLAELVREVAESFAPAAQKRGLEVSVTAPDKLVVESDRRRVKQILFNLMGNAVKFTDQGHIEIAITPREGALDIAVRDTGIGIHAEDLPKLFTAFSQIATEGRPKEGSGLGLYLSQRIAKLLGGNISVQSALGAGSQFTLALPVKRRTAS